MSFPTVMELFEDYKVSPFRVLETCCDWGFLTLRKNTRLIITFLKLRYLDAIKDLATILSKTDNVEDLEYVLKLVEALKLTLVQLHYHVSDFNGMIFWSESSRTQLRDELAKTFRVNIERLLVMINTMRPFTRFNQSPMLIDPSPTEVASN
jgi:hypothetical protein